MSRLAPTLRGVLHRAADRPTPGQPAHHRRLPRRLAAAAALRPPPHRQAALPARPGRPRRPADRAFLDHLETRTRQQRAHPQRPPGRHPLVLPLRRAAPSRARRRSSPACLPSRPNAATAASSRSSPARSRRPAGRPDRGTWTGRRDHALLAVAVADRAAGLGADRAAQQDVELGTGAHVSCRGKGRKRRCTPLRTDRSRLRRLDERTRRRPRRSAVPHPPRQPDRPRRRGTPRHQTRRRPRNAARRSTTSTSRRTSCGTPAPCPCSPASTPPSSRSGSATSTWRQRRSTCTPTCPSKNEPSPAPRRPAPRRTLPAARRAARLPRRTLIIPPPTRERREQYHDAGITRQNA